MWKQMVRSAALVSSFHLVLVQDVPVAGHAAGRGERVGREPCGGRHGLSGDGSRHARSRGQRRQRLMEWSSAHCRRRRSALAVTESSDGIVCSQLALSHPCGAWKTRTRGWGEESNPKLTQKNQGLQKQPRSDRAQDQQLLAKLEAFTAATMQQLTEKGQLNADSAIKLADYLSIRQYGRRQQQVGTGQQIKGIRSRWNSCSSRLGELAAGTNRTERRGSDRGGQSQRRPRNVRLNYLVSSPPIGRRNTSFAPAPRRIRCRWNISRRSSNNRVRIGMTLIWSFRPRRLV